MNIFSFDSLEMILIEMFYKMITFHIIINCLIFIKW